MFYNAGMNKKKIRFRQRANRYGFTINNPFITDSIKVIDRGSLTDEQKELLEQSRHDFSHLKVKEFESYFDFALEKSGRTVRKRVIRGFYGGLTRLYICPKEIGIFGKRAGRPMKR